MVSRGFKCVGLCLLLGPASGQAASVKVRGAAPLVRSGLAGVPLLAPVLPQASGLSPLASLTLSALAVPGLVSPALVQPLSVAVAPAPALQAQAPRAVPGASGSLSAMAADLPSLQAASAPADAARAAAGARFDSGARRPGVPVSGLDLPAASPRQDSGLRLAAAQALGAMGLGRASRFLAPPAPPAAPAVDAFVKELLAVLVKSGGDPTKAEDELIDVLARAHAAGQLEPVLQALVADPRAQKFLPPMPEAKRAQYAAQVAFMMGAELEGAGKVPGAKPFEPWEEMGKRHMSLIHSSAYASRGPAAASLFTEPGFVQELSALTGAAFSGTNRAKPLIDGPASFRVRFALMRRAKKSIHVLSWAFYDDATGEAAADLLIAKKREGLDVKVLVDGKTAQAHGSQVLARMRAAGIEVVLYQESARRYDGMHAKSLVVDGRFAVAGGMNFGDPYSHMGQGPKWRDTDMFYMGPSVGETARHMAALWNAQVREQGLPYGAMAAPAPAPGTGSARLAFLAGEPSGEAGILLAYLKGIAGASRVINIENAYFIEMPALRQALLEALARGVQVNILTNSAQSIDEPIVAAPILSSLPELIRAGARVSLKKGDTLHSKFMTVDGLFAILGSFNLHPRSVRYEKEIVLLSLDPRFASDLDAAFRADAEKAQAVADPDQIKVPDSALTRIVRRYLFNQL